MTKKRLSQFIKTKFETEANKHWTNFFKTNKSFFKDRHWTILEFPELLDAEVLLEVGCGLGNFINPLIGKIKKIYACDFSPVAVDKCNEISGVFAFLCDLTVEMALFEQFKLNQLDYCDLVSMVFVLSAIPKEKHKIVMKNISSVLKPNGILLFRDYCVGDYAQLRFEEESKDEGTQPTSLGDYNLNDSKILDDNFYLRSDGTMSYFFDEDWLKEITKEHFDVVKMERIERVVENRKEQIKFNRIFIQAKFKLKS